MRGLSKNVSAVAFALLYATLPAEMPKCVYSTGFETPEETAGWKCGSVWSVEKGAGVGGSAAFVWTNDDPAGYAVCNFPVAGAKEGRSYRATFKVKADSLSGAGVGCTICWHDSEGWIGGAGGTVVKWGDKRLKPDADGWYGMTIITTPPLPPTADKAYLQLYIHRGGVGRVAFDDVKITLVDERRVGSVEAFATSAYRNVAADGDVRFLATTVIPRRYRDGGTVAELSYRGADGKPKTVRMDASDPEKVETVLKVSDLAPGRHPVTVSVKGHDGYEIGGRTLTFERVERLPERSVRFDRFGRTIVEGRPFFPLGMFWSIGTYEKDPAALERYAAGPFNCLQNYDHTFTKKELDAFWAKGLRVVVGIKDLFAPVAPNIVYEGMKYRYARPKPGTVLETWEDEDRMLTEIAGSLKDHPALLGWYGCDEFRSEFRDRLRHRYELMKRVDPDHPVFSTIAGNGGNARGFIDCTDTIGIDCYTMHSRRWGKISKPGFGEAWDGGDQTQMTIEASYGLLRIWQVPQAFAFRWDVRNRPEMCFPTFEELRSQTWQEIAAGANGLFFYSYSQILNCPEPQEARDDYFRRTCAVAAEVRSQFPVLLSDPGPAPVAVPDRVRVRTWLAEDGIYALVCNTHPERRAGTVRFAGEWTSCRVLLGGGVTFAGGALELDMKPLDVAIVRLR